MRATSAVMNARPPITPPAIGAMCVGGAGADAGAVPVVVGLLVDCLAVDETGLWVGVDVRNDECPTIDEGSGMAEYGALSSESSDR